jgi:1,4-dihydroxy-2-naphthoate octaprenyltransferase
LPEGVCYNHIKLKNTIFIQEKSLNLSFFAKLFFEASRPLQIFGGIMTYSLGAGIARYLGENIDWAAFWLGLACFSLLQSSSYYLHQYFELFEEYAVSTDDARQKVRQRQFFLQLATATLAVGAVFTVLLFANHVLNAVSIILIGLALILAIGYAVPPFRLVYSGYGELLTAFLLANIAPSLAYIVQTGTIHRLLGVITLPLTFLTLATLIALTLQKYSREIKQNHKTLLVRLGWQRGIQLHHYLVVITYLIFLASNLLGFPWRLTWPTLLTIPLAAFQVWQLNQIASGAKPRWNLLSYTALATLGLTIYFLSFALWTD